MKARQVIKAFAAIIWFAAAALAGPGAVRAGDQPVVIAVAPFASTQVLLEIFGPLVRQIEARISRPVTLATAPDSRTFVQRSFAGDYDFVIVSPHVARLLEKEARFNPLVAASGRISAVLVVPKSGSIHKISDLRGKVVALHDAWSMTATLGREKLAEAGLVDGRDVELRTTLNMSIALYSVVYGQADAAIVGRNVWAMMRPEVGQEISILSEVGNYQILGAMLSHPRVDPRSAHSFAESVQDYFGRSEQGRKIMQALGFDLVRPLAAEDLKIYDKYAAVLRRMPLHGQHSAENKRALGPPSSPRATGRGAVIRDDTSP